MSFSNSNSESFGVKNNLQTYGNPLIQKNHFFNLDPNTVRIGLMDPNIAQTWAERVLSDGTTVMSIKKGDTINHTTSQPIATGLFCQRIFGPCIDYTCACGHEKIRVHLNVNVSNPVCPECHVEWTESSVRRQRLGSISLLSPVTHKWFSDSRNYIPILTGITVKTFRTLKECKIFFPFTFQKDYTSSSLFLSGSPKTLPIKKKKNIVLGRATKNLQFLLESNNGHKTSTKFITDKQNPKGVLPHLKFFSEHNPTAFMATEQQLESGTGQFSQKPKNTKEQDQKPKEPLVHQFALERDQKARRPLVSSSFKGQRARGFKASFLEPLKQQRMPKIQNVVDRKGKVSEIKTQTTSLQFSQGFALHALKSQVIKNRIFFKKVSDRSKPVVNKVNNDQLTYKKILKQNLKTKLFNYLNNNCLNIKNIIFNWSIFVSEGCSLDNNGHEVLLRSTTTANNHKEKVLEPLVFKQQKNSSKKIKNSEFNLNENFLSFLGQKGKFFNRKVEILGLDYKKSHNFYFSIATAEILKKKNCTSLSSCSTRKGLRYRALSKELYQSGVFTPPMNNSNKASFLANGVFAPFSLPKARFAKSTPEDNLSTSYTDKGPDPLGQDPKQNNYTLSPPRILAKHKKKEEYRRLLKTLALEIYKKFGLNSNLIIKKSLKFYDFSLNLEIIAWTIKKRMYCAKKLKILSNFWSTRNEKDFNDNSNNKKIQKVNNLLIQNNPSSPIPFVNNILQKKVIQNFCKNSTNSTRKHLFNNLPPFSKKSEKIEFGTLLATQVLESSYSGFGSSPFGLAPKGHGDQKQSIQKVKEKKKKVALRSWWAISTMPEIKPNQSTFWVKPKTWSSSPQDHGLPKKVGMAEPPSVFTKEETYFGLYRDFGPFGLANDKTSKGMTKSRTSDSNFEKKRFFLEKNSPKKWTKVVLNKELSFWISFSSKMYKSFAITLAKLKFKSAKTKGFISNYNSLLVCSSVQLDKAISTSSFLSSTRIDPLLQQFRLGQWGLSTKKSLSPSNKVYFNEKTQLNSPLGYNSCPIRPSFTQPEDYRRQFLKFIGDTYIQPIDIPINLLNNQNSFLFQIKNQKQNPSFALAKLHRPFQPYDYTYIEDPGFALLQSHALLDPKGQDQDSLTWHKVQEPKGPMTHKSTGPKKLLSKKTKSTFQRNKGVKVYFSESKWIAKEEKVKKILSQTGGGGLQNYLGLINLGQLVFILQNDLFEIAPRLARSQSARRILLQIVNETYNNLNQLTILLERIQKKSLKKNLKETLGLLSKRVLSQNLDLTQKNAKDNTLKQDKGFATEDNLLGHIGGKSGLDQAQSLSSDRGPKGFDLSTNNDFVQGTKLGTKPQLDYEQIDKIKQIIRIKIENLEKKYKEVKKEYKTVKKICTDFQNRKNAHKRRYKLAFQLFRTTSNPGVLTLSSIPVLPPGLRPIIDVPKIGPITADLNIRYRGLIFALRNLRELAYVDFRNAGAAQASVQEAVDDLLYTGGKTRKDKGFGLSPPNLYKSLAMRLKGKHGRFRGNLLGKRVDYSGRSVIVVGPTLKIHQCGLPFEIAVKLFNPFLIRRLIQKGLCKNVYKAKQILIGGKFKPLIWALCREVMLEHLVLLNRAPTLHRLGVQAFIPILISGRAILLHPLVCTGFNADFDGDQMGVHVPLFPKARAEAWKMMWSRNNFLSPSSGEPILLPSQDMVLGCYYLTEMYSEKLQSKTKRSLKENFEVNTFAALIKKGPSPIFLPKNPQGFSLVSTNFGLNKQEKYLNFDCRIRKTTLKLALVTISKILFTDLRLFQSLKKSKPRYIGEFFTLIKEPDFNIKTITVLPIKSGSLKVSPSYKNKALPDDRSGPCPKGNGLDTKGFAGGTPHAPKGARGNGPLGQSQGQRLAFGFAWPVARLRSRPNASPLSQAHRPGRQSQAMLKNSEIGLDFVTLRVPKMTRGFRENDQTSYLKTGVKAAKPWYWGKATLFPPQPIPRARNVKPPFSNKTRLAFSLVGTSYGNRDSSLGGNKEPKFFVYTQLIGSFWPLVYKSELLNWTGYSSLTPSQKLIKNRGFGTLYEIKKQEEVNSQNLVQIRENLSRKQNVGINENAFYSHGSVGASSEFPSPWFVDQRAYSSKYNKSQKTKFCGNVFCGAALGPKYFRAKSKLGSPEHTVFLSAKIVLDKYYRGFYNLQSIVWVSLSLKKNLATNYFPEKTKNIPKNLENEGFLTPTLELRISPYGITQLLQISGSKKSLFYNSLLFPTKKTVKTPFEVSSIRTTVGRLLFNDILQKFEISLKSSN